MGFAGVGTDEIRLSNFLFLSKLSSYVSGRSNQFPSITRLRDNLSPSKISLLHSSLNIEMLRGRYIASPIT